MSAAQQYNTVTKRKYNMGLFREIVNYPGSPRALAEGDPRNLIQLAHPHYMQGHRFYHDWNHIVEGAALALTLSEDTPEFNLNFAQQAAWLFHDSVYVPQSQDPKLPSMMGANEVLSAQLFVTLSKDPSVRDILQGNIHLANIHKLIMDTVGHWASSEAAKPILDIDLAGFRAPNLFARNTELLKREFGLEESVFEQGQANFLVTFLDREFIYHTEFARNNWEKPARANIIEYIRQIESKYSTVILKR